jgi:hypothetical protein
VFVRKWISERDIPDFIELISYSIPNFFEAILGSLILTAIFLRFKNLLGKRGKTLKTKHIYILVFLFSSVYVISQELNFLTLGGKNIYDPNDIAASILGLLFTYLLIHFYGFHKESSLMDNI